MSAMASGRLIAAHLHRRAGFGALPHELDELEHWSFDRLVTSLIAGLGEVDKAGNAVPPPHLTAVPVAAADPDAYEGREHGELVALTSWWVSRMIVTDTPLHEKLTLFLHEQFPTGYDKVRYIEFMYRQNQLFRSLGAGAFDVLTKAAAADPAMLLWLDAAVSIKKSPNENFARELMERFTMGIGNYSETDVSEAARAFTGWEIDYATGEARLDALNHDGGVKHVLGHVGDLSGDDVVEIVTHTKASARWVTSRIWSLLAFPVSASAPVVGDLSPVYAKHLDMTELLEAILRHPAFVSAQSVHALVKQPVEFVVGTMRLLGLSAASFGASTLQRWLADLGQELFAPPNVGGWGQNAYWVSTAASAQQLEFAYEAAQAADLSAIASLTGRASQQVAAVQRLLAIDSFSAGTYKALWDVADAKGAEAARNLVVLGLVSPEYLLN